ncbi:MAG: GNAT family N-acetyltransferase, partial [Candidatus Kariarchaeaceae archaeon]
MSKNNLSLPLSIESERLFLRPYQHGDGQSFFKMLEDGNREYLDELLGGISKAVDSNETEKWVADLAHDWEIKERFVLGIWDKFNETYYGHIWIEPINWELPHFEIGWFVDKNHQGKGIITEATRRSIKFIFDDLQGQNIRVRVRDHGLYAQRSINIAERCNFRKEGLLRDTVKLDDGSIISEHYFSLLKTEF